MKYGKRDSAPDGIDGGGIDYESSGSGDDDSVFTMSDGSPSLPKRRKQKRKNVRFIDVSDSGYSTLPRSAPIHEVTDEREGVTYKTTSNSSVLANRSSSDEGYQWQTTGCTEGRPESGNQHSTRYIELDDNYDSGQFVSDVPTALNVPERQTVQRSPQGESLEPSTVLDAIATDVESPGAIRLYSYRIFKTEKHSMYYSSGNFKVRKLIK